MFLICRLKINVFYKLNYNKNRFIEYINIVFMIYNCNLKYLVVFIK